jgi:hypothetical protein
VYDDIVPRGSARIFLLSDHNGTVFQVNLSDAAAVPPQGVTAVFDFFLESGASYIDEYTITV